jgi:phosphoglucosamine mutase
MARSYFGTDGIRGKANQEPMTAETALRVGMAAGKRFRRGRDRHHRVVIGKDTRLSGYMLENALTAGFISVGMDVVLVGPMPTPAVAMLTRSLRADLGVMISASHNPFEDNGIKLFGPDGYKLSDETELEIEHLIANGIGGGLAEPSRLGRASRLEDAQGRYIEYAKNTFTRGHRLAGLRIVVDCANGAAYKVAPTVLWELEAEVVPIGVKPDGTNINRDCGSTRPEYLQEQVLAQRADLGIALDGDADRVIIVDEKGDVVDGDQIIAIVAERWKNEGRLRGDCAVATIMSNLGLERHLATQGIRLERAAVGDRYVLERMRELGCNVGGEQSGHVIVADYATTGDGLIAALQVLSTLVETGKRASEICRRFTPLPQLLKNVRHAGGKPLETDSVKAAITAAQSRLDGKGRLVVRASGTEPVIRLMAEGEDERLIETVIDELADAVKRVA